MIILNKFETENIDQLIDKFLVDVHFTCSGCNRPDNMDVVLSGKFPNSHLTKNTEFFVIVAFTTRC